jgi:DNA methylase
MAQCDYYEIIKPIMEEAPSDWQDSCTYNESALHQLSPYIGKLKSSIAHSLIEQYSSREDLVVDPFSGSGTIPLEATIMGRHTFASDIGIYARVLNDGKLFAPQTMEEAIAAALRMLKRASKMGTPDFEKVPQWVQDFFNPRTLHEILNFAQVCRESKNYFIFSCFLGILHHQRPGFLSYPSSHLTPYLRDKKYPREKYPEMYEYRDISSRLIKKIQRAYKRHNEASVNIARTYRKGSIENITLPDKFDCLITSPPYMNTLDYGRDNRLRLWFIDPCFNKPIDSKTTKDKAAFHSAMKSLATKVENGLKPQGYCVLVVGEKSKHLIQYLAGHIYNTFNEYAPSLELEKVIVDKIPDIRRARRNCNGTKKEHILIFRKN